MNCELELPQVRLMSFIYKCLLTSTYSGLKRPATGFCANHMHIKPGVRNSSDQSLICIKKSTNNLNRDVFL